MKITTTLALAIGLVGLAGCNQQPQGNNVAENAALNESENLEMTANATNESMNLGNESNAVENNAAATTTANNATTNY